MSSQRPEADGTDGPEREQAERRRAEWEMPVIGPEGIERPDRVQDGAGSPPAPPGGSPSRESRHRRTSGGGHGRSWWPVVVVAAVAGGIGANGGWGGPDLEVQASAHDGRSVVQIDGGRSALQIRAGAAGTPVQVTDDEGEACDVDGDPASGNAEMTCDSAGTYLITVPAGADLEVSGGSGDVDIQGDYGALDAGNGSGGLTFAGTLRAVDVDAGSGQVDMDLRGSAVTGEVDGGSGGIAIRGVNPHSRVETDTGSGSTQVDPGLADGDGSGGTLIIEGGSGDITVAR